MEENENDNTEKVESFRTQIGWGTLGGRLYADVPVTNERIYFDMKDLHESWRDFILAYGVKQFVSSSLAPESFKVKEELGKIKVELPGKTEEEYLTIVKERKIHWLKENAPKLRTALWENLQTLKVEKTVKERAKKESAANVIAGLREKAEKLGMSEEMLKSLFG